MAELPDKAQVYDALLAALRERLSHTQALIRHAQASATDTEAKAENKYDTRGLEMSYVAAGHTDRIATLRQTLSSYHFWQLPEALGEVRPGALLRLIGDDDSERLVFIAPYGDAETLDLEGAQVRVITLRSPLGRALVGKGEGDEASVRGRTWEIDALR